MAYDFFSWFQLVLGVFGILFLFLLMVGVFLLLKRKKSASPQTMHIKNINKVFLENKKKILQEVLSPIAFKKHVQQRKLEEKKLRKNKTEPEKKRVFVLDFKGDIDATGVVFLRDQVTTLLQVARPDCDEIVLRLESPGGAVHSYGLAAAQLARLRDRGITLTVCVDKVAASGGYMMACLAHSIIAAPFAILGSIGVVASLPNFHRFLQKKDVDYLEFTAGEHKRTVTAFGEITEQGKEKLTQQIGEIHHLFKEHVSRYRNGLDINQVSTGEFWYGQQALERGLVDALGTSDDYLLAASEHCDVYQIFNQKKETLREKLLGSLALAENLLRKSSFFRV